MHPVTRALLFSAGLAICLSHCSGPARAGTVEQALAVACPGHENWAPYVQSASRHWMVHPVLLVAVMEHESGCRMGKVGAHGERCAMQLLGVARNGRSNRELADPAICTDTGARWLSLRELDCGSKYLGLDGYNARKCKHGRKYARRVLALERRIWKELERNSARRSIVR